MTQRTRRGGSTKEGLRNLHQYKKMTDDEFEAFWENRSTGLEINQEFEKRVQRKLDEFERDYEVSDMKVNDFLALRALAQAFITLEDLEHYSYTLRHEGIDENTISKLARIGELMSAIRRDISTLQADLKISRKSRKGDKEESVLNFLEDLKSKAAKFYKDRMFYVFCPKCNMLMFTGWFLWPEGNNKVRLHCERVLENGEKCTGTVFVSSKELVDNRGVNTSNIPDFFK